MKSQNYKPTVHPHIVKIQGKSGIRQTAIKGTYIRFLGFNWLLQSAGWTNGNSERLSFNHSCPTARCHFLLSCHKEEIEEFIQENEKAYGEYFVEQKSLRVAEDQAIEPG